MSKKTKITFDSLQTLVKEINTKCKKSPEDEKLQERRRALIALRRNINGEEGVTPEELLSYAEILSEAERTISKKLEELKLDKYALQHLQLADDIDEIVLEIVTIEEEDDNETV